MDDPVCTRCGVQKPRSGFTVNRHHKSGLQSACRLCMTIAARRRRGVFDPETEMGDWCVVCRGTDGLCLDHDHITGLARATLCRRCNTVLGLVRDDEELLGLLARYLESHACN